MPIFFFLASRNYSNKRYYTYNGNTSDSDQSGGCLGNPIIGKGSISNLVIFSFSMTNGLASGNKLVAYDKDLGTEVWEYNMNIYSYSSPVDFYDADGNAYIIICDSIGQVHMIHAETGIADPKDRRITYIQTKRNLGLEDETASGVCIEASPVIYKGMMDIYYYYRTQKTSLPVPPPSPHRSCAEGA